MQWRRGDITPLVDLTTAKSTGPFRTRRPVYVQLLRPFENTCPAGEHIQAWLVLAQADKFRAAWERHVKDNPLPAVHWPRLLSPMRERMQSSQRSMPPSTSMRSNVFSTISP